MTGLVALAGTAWFATAAAGGDGPALTAGSVIIAVLAILSGRAYVRFSAQLNMSFVYLFWALGFLVLSPREVAVVGLAILGFRIVLSSLSWQELIGTGGFVAASYGAGFAVVHAMAVLGVPYGHPWGVLAMTFGAYVAMTLAEEVLLIVINLGDGEGSLRARWRTALAETRNGLREVAMPMVLLAPMSAIGAYAYSYSSADGSYIVAVLLVPLLAAWYVSRQSLKLAEAKRTMGIDALTGLSNRRAFFERAEEELRLAQRFGHSLALIMGDLDNFKRVNDTHGHLAGDQVLCGAAASLRRVLDENVFPYARFGGEEFVILMPVIGREQVLESAERVRAEVEGELAAWGTSISLGVAYHQSGESIESLVDRADKALYNAKYAGKNRVLEWVDDDGVSPTGAAA